MKKHAYDEYIGRGGHGETGYFGNPVVAGRVCPRCSKLHDLPGDTLPCFEAYFRERLASDSVFLSRVRALKGKVLGCFCTVGNPCHGQVIVKYLEEEAE